MWETVDPEGRRVILTEDVWAHILEDHTEIEGDLMHVLRAVAAPTRWLPGRRPDEVWFYLRGPGPSLWLKVVVHYEDGEGRVVTAFPRRALP